MNIILFVFILPIAMLWAFNKGAQAGFNLMNDMLERGHKDRMRLIETLCEVCKKEHDDSDWWKGREA